MTFEQYVSEIQRLAEENKATDKGKRYCEDEAWREAFNEGLTPKEAWLEECSAAADMLG